MTDELDPADAVVVAYVHDKEVSYSWHHSMVELIGWDMAHRCRTMQGGYIAMRYGTDGLVQARNQTIRTFLSEGKADWLFWLDTDMGFAPDTLDRLCEAADADARPIVGALAFSQREHEGDTMGGWRCLATPTIFDWATIDDQQGFAVRWDFPPNTLVRCAGTGSACVLVHRSVFERIDADERIKGAWYDRLPNTTTGQMISEDLSFCVRAGALGIPVHVHTGVQTTHHKSVWLSDVDYWQQRAVNPDPVAAS